MTREELEMRTLIRESDVIDRTDGSVLAKAFNYLREKYIEQEPKTGHWIDIKYHHYYNDGDIETTELRCSRCNEIVEWDIELLHKPYYCENCGAKMLPTDLDCNSCKYQNVVDGSNCYECVKGICNNYTAESEKI